MIGHPATANRKRAMVAAAEASKPYEPFSPAEFYQWWLHDLAQLPEASDIDQAQWELLQVEDVPSREHLPTWLQAAAALFEHVESRGGRLALARSTRDGTPVIMTYRLVDGPEVATPGPVQ